RTGPRACDPAGTRTATGSGIGVAAVRGHGPGTTARRRPGCPPRPEAAPATRSGRRRSAAGPLAPSVSGSSPRADAVSRPRRDGPRAARPRTRGWSPASVTGGRARPARWPAAAPPGGQQLARVTGGVHHLLQVVQDEQPRVIAEDLGQGPDRVMASSGTNAVPASKR